MKNLIFVCLITLSSNCFAQDKFSLSGFIGYCDLRFIQPDVPIYPGDQFSKGYSYKVGTYYDFLNSKQKKLYPTIGLSFTGKTALNYCDYPYALSRSKFYTIDIPVKLNYQINQWLSIKGGLNGSILVMMNGHIGPTDPKLFTYGFLLGGSIRYRRFSLDLEYVRDFNDMLKHIVIFDASYRCSLVHIGIGYHFSSFKGILNKHH